MRLSVALWEVLLLVEMVQGVLGEPPASATARSTGEAGRRRRMSSRRVARIKQSLESEIDSHKPPTDFWWKSQVDDPKRGFSQGRIEFRRGKTVVGQYEYSDGHVHVRVVYKADEKGFRVLKEERVPLKSLGRAQPTANPIPRWRGRNSLKRESKRGGSVEPS